MAVKKYRVWLYVDCSMEEMIDKNTLKKQYGGDFNKVMEWLYNSDGIGIFKDNPKFSHTEALDYTRKYGDDK